jgi:hypothetical protein
MARYTVRFPEYYDDLAAFEIESKGFLDGVVVEFDDGRRISLSFRDSWNVQLDHDVTGQTPSGIRYLMIPHLVIVDVVSRAAILESIEALVKDGALATSGER